MTRQDSPEGAVLHADVRFGDVVLMVATADAPYEAPPLHGVSTGGGLYLWMPEAADVATGTRGTYSPGSTW